VCLAIAVAALLATGSCFTPSIPIPPPDARLITFALDAEGGQATFHYDPMPEYANALVYVYNRTQGRGVIDTARPDGSIGPTAPFPAVLDDQIAVTVETDEQTASTCVVIREGTPSQFCP
jgi:hypothetical protein